MILTKSLMRKIFCLIFGVILIITSIPGSFFNQVEYNKLAIMESNDLHNIQGINEKYRVRAQFNEDQWTTFQFDYFNSGNSSSKAPDTNNILWRFNDNGDQKGEIYSTPIAVDDFVYFTTNNGYLYAVDRKTGDKKWKFDMQKDTYATPTFSNGYIYIGTGTDYENTENYLYRISATTGQEDISFRIQLSDSAIVGAPLVVDNAGVNDDRLFFGTLKNNSIYSYNLSTNPPQLEWAYQVPNATTYSSDGIWSCLVYEDNDPPRILFTVNSDSFGTDIPRGLFCLNARNGKELWRFPTEPLNVKFQTFSSPTIFYDKNSNQSKVLFGAGIYYESKPNEGIMYCLDLSIGTELWNFSTGEDTFGYGIITSPAVAYDKILFGACNGKLYALDFNGNLIWGYQTNNTVDGIYSSPAVANEKIYFGSTDRIFYCLDVHNGSLIWRYNTEFDSTGGNYGVASSPAIAYNRVFVGSCNSYLYCFGSEGSKPPTIIIDKPIENEMLNGTVDVTGIVEDDIAVLLVQIKIGNGSWLNTTGKTSWTYSWDTTEVTDGIHQIYVRAFDETGFSMKKISVIVNNGGSEIFIQITSHTEGQVVSGITKFNGIAGHNLGLEFEVQIKIDDISPWQKVIGTANWYYDWDTTEFPDGEHLIQFRGFDGFINSTLIQITVSISNHIEPIIPGNYPMFRANQNRSGITDYEIPTMGAELWKFETENAIESSAIFYNNRIYFGSNDWFVYCINGKTGQLQWKYETGNMIRSTPAIANKRLYIGSQDYHLYCLNAISGEFIWKYRTNGAIDSSPLIIGESVIVGSYDGKLYSLNTEDGSMQWVFDTGGEIWGSPAYSDNCIYIGSIDGKMHCVWVTNGTERWNFTTNQFASFRGIYSTPIIAENKVIFGSEDNIVYCLNISNGKRIWMFKTTGFVYSSAAVSSDKIFVTSLEEENDGILYALPLNNPNGDSLITPSEVIWKFTTHDYDGGSSPIVSVSSGWVVVGSNAGDAGGDGKVYCLDEDTGEEIWNSTTNGDIHGTPQVALNRVYIGSLDNNMYCLGVKHIEQNVTKIKINISLPTTSVHAGDTIENITFTALTQDDKPVAQAWFNFNVTLGTLSDYYGTAFGDGTYSLTYIAPEPEKVDDNITVTISVNASRSQYEPGNNSIKIIVIPHVESHDNNSNNSNGDYDDLNQTGDNDTGAQDSGLDFKLIGVIVLLVIIVLIIAIEIIINKKKD
jgi:outer membrane protein assembly factor BamB